jgi:hypothetical protein
MGRVNEHSPSPFMKGMDSVGGQETLFHGVIFPS